MSALSIRLPNSLHKNLKRISEKEGVSIQDEITSVFGFKKLRCTARYCSGNREVIPSQVLSINQLIASAVAEKVSALETETYLQARAIRASREAFEQALAAAPDVEPDLEDRL
jgi:hypothetical protein